MKFRIVGTDQGSGERVKIFIDADDQEAAEDWALANGILDADVSPQSSALTTGTTTLGEAQKVYDGLGNSYKRVDFGFGTPPVGRLDTASIYPLQEVSDLLVFERPVAKADHLDLELPASNFGGNGMLRLRIPRSIFAKTIRSSE